MATGIVKARTKAFLPHSVIRVYRILLSTYRHPTDVSSVLMFLLRPHGRLSFLQRLAIVKRFYAITYAVGYSHTQEELLRVFDAVLSASDRVPGCIVEAGSFKGASAAKLSIAAALTGREVVVFDSFEGLPDNRDPADKNIWGRKFHETFTLAKGTYKGALEEVKGTIARFGHLEGCRFVKGWFDQTMPNFHEPIAVAYLDVDLASSTRTCLKYLYPLLAPGGVVFSQDAHFVAVRELLDDEHFWTTEVGYPKPRVEGLGQRRLVWIRKPLEPSAVHADDAGRRNQAATR